MLFSSIPFLFWFLPCVFVLYAITPRNLKNVSLLLSSLFFYGWGEPIFVIWMLLAIIFAYVCAFLMDYFCDAPHMRRTVMLFSVLVNLASLGYFKYADFFITNFNAATGLSVPLLNIVLPIGISFYTFQVLSYIIDVYRKKVKAQKNIITLATYIALFPQLIAGPIVRYTDIEGQLADRIHSAEKIAIGIRRFIIGLSKKVLLANQLFELCRIFHDSDEKAVLFFWFYAAAYALAVYFDFSGYSDMAIGLGRIFGFDFPENFNYPFISKSITEFWRRWHVSLGSWFRDYVYIPIGGKNKGALRGCFNIFLVFMLTGFWHGASWNFVIWGIYFAILLILEKLWLLKVIDYSSALGHSYTIIVLIFSFVIFDASSMTQALTYAKAMVGFGAYPLMTSELIYYFRSYFVIFLVAIFGATPLLKHALEKFSSTNIGERLMVFAEPLVLVVLLVLCTAFIVDGSFNPFLYFRF